MEGQKVNPLQERILALMLEGKSDEEVSEIVGIHPDLLEAHKAALRKTLDIADEDGLHEYIHARMKRDAVEPSMLSSPRHDERRIRILLRLTLTELLDVASNAELRAQMLLQTVEALGTEDPNSAEQEARDLLRISRELKDTMDRLLSEIRSRS